MTQTTIYCKRLLKYNDADNSPIAKAISNRINSNNDDSKTGRESDIKNNFIKDYFNQYSIKVIDELGKKNVSGLPIDKDEAPEVDWVKIGNDEKWEVIISLKTKNLTLYKILNDGGFMCIKPDGQFVKIYPSEDFFVYTGKTAG